jgi:hypothetical protein
MAGKKFTLSELQRTLEAAEALHALAVHDLDFLALEALIEHFSQFVLEQPGNYAAKHRLRMLISLRAWRRVKAKDEVQTWY